ncbi:shikimate dehydrogenase [Listeria ilorinensis]|uniref:shikimate dehydrogenase n=1 Tax=Listeria ilorinensis TaxID=2867439 RepID=UPI001EF65143|nr:shikimate dehydrogenase [Listeria ilorinensis]
MENRISGTTRLLGLIGSPVDHSKSPVMYNYSFQKAGVDYAYLAFDIQIDQVAEAIAALKTLNMRGANVTMPCKTEVIKHLDALSPAARLVGAVNTIIHEDGRLTGHMTDGAGYVNDLLDHGISVADKKITIIGAGGAATAIQVQCALDGARAISIFNQKDAFFKRAEKTAEAIRAEMPDCQVQLFDLEDLDALRNEIQSSDILANATLVGMHPHEDQSPVPDPTVFHKGLTVTDVIYTPEKTRLLREAETRGAVTIGGLGMLLHQGAAAYKLYTGLDMPIEEVKTKFFK